MTPKAPKHKRIRKGRVKNKAYMMWVCTLPCVICQKTPVQAHHPIMSDSRHKYGKSHDTEVINLCFEHHHELHMQGNESLFEEKYGLDFYNIARELNKQYTFK